MSLAFPVVNTQGSKLIRDINNSTTNFLNKLNPF
jgi:hypothetical protein